MINSLDKFALKMTLERLNDKVSQKAEIIDIQDLKEDLGMAKENMKSMHSRINFCEKVIEKLEQNVVEIKQGMKFHADQVAATQQKFADETHAHFESIKQIFVQLQESRKRDQERIDKRLTNFAQKTEIPRLEKAIKGLATVAKLEQIEASSNAMLKEA